MPKKNKITVEITHKSIIFTVFFLLLLYFLFFIREILLQVFVAILITTILNPLVTKLAYHKIPRGISIFVSYVIAISVVTVAIVGIAPPLVEQSAVFLEKAPEYIDTFSEGNVFAQQLINEMVSFVGQIPGQVARASISILSNIVDVFTVLIFAFYLLLARNKLTNHTELFLSQNGNKEFHKILDEVEKKLGGWAIGQLSLMFLVGISTYVGLVLLRVPFALPLALLSGLLEIVPYVGPIIASVPAILIGFTISPFLGFATAALTFLVQQIENYVFVPKVMEKTAGVSPLTTLLALSVGFKIAGILGVFVSVPAVIILQIIVKEYFKSR